MKNKIIVASSSFITCFLSLVLALPGQAAIDATMESGATGMDTYYIRSDRGDVWRASDNFAGWFNNHSDPFTETYRDADILELTNVKTGVTRFDFRTGDIFSVTGESTQPRKIGVMANAHQLSPSLVNSFTYIRNSYEVSNNVASIETAWDQIFLEKDEGSPSGWASEISVSRSRTEVGARPIASDDIRYIARVTGSCSLECKFQKLEKQQVWRVELGDIFFKLFPTGGDVLLSTTMFLDKIQAKSVLFKEVSRDNGVIILEHTTGLKVELNIAKHEIWAAKAGQSMRLVSYMAPEPFGGWNRFALRSSSTVDAGVHSLLGTTAEISGLRDLQIKSDNNSSFSFFFPPRGGVGTMVFGEVNVSAAGQGDSIVGTITIDGRESEIQMLLGANISGRSVTGYSLGSLGWDARQSSLVSTIQRVTDDPRLEMAYLQLKGRSEFTLVEPDSRREFSNPLVGIYKSRTRMLGQQNGVPLVVNLASSRLEALNSEAVKVLTNGARVPHTRLTWMHNYYPGQYEKNIPSLKRQESPGFQVQNRTDWPVYVQLAQGSTCYNRRILQPGESVNWDTGAVWFAIEATMNQSNVPTDIECSTQALIIAGATVAGGLLTVATGGAGGGAGAALMAMAVGGTFGVIGEYATSAMNAAEWTDDEKQTFQIALFVVEGITSMGIGAASAGSEALEAATSGLTVVAKVAAKEATRAAVTRAITAELAEGMVGFILDAHIEVGLNLLENGTEFDASGLTVSEGTPEEQEALMAEIDLNQFAALNDQYAGTTWPFEGEDRIRPTYVITGGPLYLRGIDGESEFVIEEVQEMKIQQCDYDSRHEKYTCVGDSQ